MRWTHGGPRRASPTSGRWSRLGRIEVARLRIGGDRPAQVLLIGDRAALDELGPDGADLASSTAGSLAAMTERGVDLDLLAAPLTALPAVRADDRFWRLWRYEALVVLLPHDQHERVRALQTMEQILPRIRSQSLVLIVDVGSGPAALVASDPAREPGTRAVGRIVVDPGASGGAVAGGALAEALVALGLLDPPISAAPAAPDGGAHRLDTPLGVIGLARPGLDRVVLIAKRSFGVDVAAVNLLARDDLITVAAVGGELGRRPRTGTLCDRESRRGDLDVIPDTWREPSLRGFDAVQGPDAIRFYAGHTIGSFDGDRVGALCIYDRRPHDPAEFDFSMLRDLALLAEAELVAAGA